MLAWLSIGNGLYTVICNYRITLYNYTALCLL